MKYLTSRQLVIAEAKKRKIVAKEVGATNLVKMRYKNHIEYYFEQIISPTTAVANKICKNKDITKTMLRKNGISVPEGNLMSNADYDEAYRLVKEIGFPIVLKPHSGAHGESVYLSINTKDDFDKKWKEIGKNYKKIIIEKYYPWKEYRIFATKDKTVGIIHRIPANITGDGKHTISELIRIKNSDPRRGSSVTSPLVKIKIDVDLKNNLGEQNLKLTDVAAKNKTVFLRKQSNISMGGDSIDYTNMAHASIKKIAVDAIRSIPGLAYGGVDLLCKDIKQIQNQNTYTIIEINSCPGFNIHHYPYEGKQRNVAGEIINLAFPELKIKI